jgi:hypothetical protein
MIKLRRMRWAGHAARIRGYDTGVKPEGKRPLGSPRRRLVDNIKMDLREIGWGAMEWIEVAKYRDQWSALESREMNLRVP